MLQRLTRPQADVLVFPRVRVAIGMLVWSAAWFLGRFPLEAAILLFAPLVIVPLARGLIPDRRDGHPWEAALVRVIEIVDIPAALLLVISFLGFGQGATAGLLAFPWFVVTLLHAARGLIWTGFQPADIGYRGALVLLSVGGFGAMASQFGWRPGGFSDAIILLTGVHFHYAAFALPILASRVANTSPGWVGRITVVGLTVGIPLVGLGITFSPALEIVAVALLVGFCLVLAALLVRFALRQPPQAFVPALIAAVSLVTSMILAAIFGTAEFLGTTWISIPSMVATHGAANAFGFTLCGLLAAYRSLRRE